MWYEKLIAIKKECGKTTDEISELSGVPKGTLNKIFSGGTKDPQLATIKAILYSLGYSLNDLDDNPSNKISSTSLDKQELEKNYEKLNSSGQQALLEQSRMMAGNPTYRKDDELQAFLAERDKYVKKHALPFAAAGGDTSNLVEARDLYDAKQMEKKDGN